MLTLHHLSQSRSFRILWLLEELKAAYGLSYELISYQRSASYLAPEALEAIHPMGKSPILVDDSLPSGEQALVESAVIIEYLLKTYDTNRYFCPSDNWKSWHDYTFWLHFAESTLMPPLVMGLILQKAVAKSPFFVRPIVRQVKKGADRAILSGTIEKSLQLLNTHLKERHWLSKDALTGADIQLYFAAAAARQRFADFSQFSSVINWMTRCEARDAFQKAVALGGKPI